MDFIVIKLFEPHGTLRQIVDSEHGACSHWSIYVLDGSLTLSSQRKEMLKLCHFRM